MTATDSSITTSPKSQGLSLVQRLARGFLITRLNALKEGALLLKEGDSQLLLGSGTKASAVIHINNPAFYDAVLLGGSLGAAEAYCAGHWDSPDLVAVIALMSRNMEASDSLESGAARLTRPLLRLAHSFKRNTRSGARRNIKAHYDLSNEFFSRFLGQTMMYSSAVFPHEGATLEQASQNKLERVCRKLELKSSDHLLEIGTGWGSMAIWAAERYGCRVTTTTISQAQYDYAKSRIEAAGLGHRISLLLCDYRDLRGSYDKLVSIEMIEAVGADFLGRFMGQCSGLLKPDGAMLLQAITMPDHRYRQTLRDVDFIKRYIFPGSFIPSIGAITVAAGDNGDLRLTHLEDQTPHYAETLRLWRHNFERTKAYAEIDRDEGFQRLWRYYFCYCEGGFRERVIASTQMLFTKPANRFEPMLLPLGQADRGVKFRRSHRSTDER